MAYAQGSDVFRSSLGNRRVTFGTFTQAGGDTGGTVSTGLDRVEAFFMTGLNTWSASGGTVTAVTLNPGGAQAGSWIAIGY